MRKYRQNRRGKSVDAVISDGAIDAANTRASREDDEDYDGLRISEIHRTEGLRLHHGYMMMDLSGDDWGDD